MHGGRFGEERKRGRHMWAGISRANSIVAGDVSSSSSLSPANSFYKDGRKICVGDCALFKPPQDSPPFIGIIRVLTTDEENKLKLSINCLYRPAEVKLGKGIELEAAPNEIFYSFHKDKIPAASLLHPCKVAFLPKGVELPSGISAFVCRRVYDIDNKCLWWLTDHNYNCELQEEVDQLLHKTRLEMHASVQSGGRSPKPVNSPTSTSQLKASSDSVQNSASSLHSQGKGKKRERGDQGSEPVKRERISKVEDGDSGSFRSEGWTAEIAKFTEKGGLVDFDGVEKLLQLMLPEKSSRKVDLVGRSVMAGVVSATDKLDCLNQFVQHGLPVFDEWLQEVHKGKVSDGGDKSVEDFLLVLLRALDKLPVNLHALQMCNIGKSVNLLRSHKNSDIQKKARSLVDTWKKRVEAEMDARSGSNQAAAWPARRRLAEASHNGNRQIGVSSDVTVKSSGAHPSATKPGSFKPVHGEAMTNSAPVSAKSTPSPGSVDQPRSIDVNGTSELPVAVAREERSSSSSQSHNNSQSCSSDHGKTGGFSGKEDARSSSAGSLGNKGSSGHRKSVKGFTGSSQSVVQKDTEGSRSSPSHRNSASGRVSHSNLTTEKAADTLVVEGSNSKLIEGSNNKLIVKIPNIGRSPARSASGGSLEDPSVMNSRASSPVHSEKHEHFEHNSKPKTDTYQSNVTYDANAESWRCNDSKEVLTGSDGDGSPGTVADDEPRRAGNNSRKVAETLKATTSSTSGNEHKKAKVHDASFKSINALIESCVKYSESETFMSIGDDVGMNLLANVAAGEMSKSDVGTPVVESSGTGDSLEVKTCPDGTAQHNNQIVDSEHQKQSVAAVTSLGRSADGRTTASSQKPTGDIHEQSTSAVDVEPRPEPIADSNMKLETLETMTPVSLRAASEKASDGVGDEPWDKKVGGDSSGVDRLVDAKDRLCASAPADNKPDVSVVKSETKAIDGSLQNVSVDGQKDNKFNLSETTCTTNLKVEDKFKASEGEVSHPSISIKELVSENVDRVKSEPDVKNDGRNESAESEKTEQGGKTNLKHDTKPERMENNDNEDKLTGVPDSLKASVVEQQVRSRGSNSSGIEADETEECMSNASPVSTSVADREGKLAFDLNEGFNADEGKYGEQNIMKIPACSAAMKLVSPMPLPVLSSPNVIHAAVTVPSAAKRAYVPMEDLLKNRGELGWKGSASAFRPAEPRRAVESSAVVTNSSLSDTSISKSGRPPLDFDLNVADDTVVEDVAVRSSNQVTVPESNLANNHGQGHDQLMGSIPARKSSGFDLDLNRVEEPIEVGSQLAGNTNGLDLLSQPVKSISDGLLNGKPNNRRDFDLNDGPVVDEVSTDPSPFSQQLRSSVSFQPPSSVRMNSTEMGNFSSWFPQGSAYPSVNIQSILPDRDNSFQIVGPGGHQRMLGHPSGSTPFTPDVYRGPLLSSSPAVPFPSTTFQYPVFPIGNSFPLPSATFSGASATYVDSSPGGRLCFPAMPSQVLAPAGTVPSNYIRAPFVVGFSDSNNSGAADNNRKWGRQGFDLNTGPLAPDVGGNVELSSIASRQLSATSSQALPEEQARLYQVAGGNILKRPEPEGGWEGFKQTSWH